MISGDSLTKNLRPKEYAKSFLDNKAAFTDMTAADFPAGGCSVYVCIIYVCVCMCMCMSKPAFTDMKAADFAAGKCFLYVHVCT